MQQLIRRSLFRFSSYKKYPFIAELGLHPHNQGALYDGHWQTTNSTQELISINPATEEVLATTLAASPADYEKALLGMQSANKEWKSITMPARGEIVRQIGDAFRAKKEPLGRLLSLEMGKILAEGLGEVQETIDICDMACGLSRTIGYFYLHLEAASSILKGQITL
jgi:aldehyde dehydrogenase family 7 protein A1